MTYRAILFDVGGPIDMEFAWEIAVDSAIAAACGLEGIRVDQAAVDDASDRAVAAFAPDAYAHMVETLCGGDLATMARVEGRRRAMTAGLDLFQLRPDIDGMLRRLQGRSLALGIVANQPATARQRLERAGIGDLFAYQGLSGETGLRKPDPRAFTTAAEALGVALAQCIMVGDRIDIDVVPAKALGMATILLRSGRHRRQRPRSEAEQPDAIVTDVLELEATILAMVGKGGSIDLPDLSPDVRFQRMPRDAEALGFTFEAKRAAMGPYIVERWGWDEALQLRLHGERFAKKPFFRILWDDKAVGTLSVMRCADHFRFGEFYLFPEYQRRGLGSRILRHCLALADGEGMPVRLEHLKWNPVGSLYRRHGFIVTGESEIHWFMERPAGPG